MICIFCFYNISSGIQAKLAFSKTFKHCNVITFDGSCWLVAEFDSQGLHLRRIKAFSSVSLIRGLKHIGSLSAMIAVQVNYRATIFWKPFVARSCNELCRYQSGVNIGYTFNPKHLYNKLIKYDGTNYEILYQWRR